MRPLDESEQMRPGFGYTELPEENACEGERTDVGFGIVTALPQVEVTEVVPAPIFAELVAEAARGADPEDFEIVEELAPAQVLPSPVTIERVSFGAPTVIPIVEAEAEDPADRPARRHGHAPARVMSVIRGRPALEQDPRERSAVRAPPEVKVLEPAPPTSASPRQRRRACATLIIEAKQPSSISKLFERMAVAVVSFLARVVALLSSVGTKRSQQAKDSWVGYLAGSILGRPATASDPVVLVDGRSVGVPPIEILGLDVGPHQIQVVQHGMIMIEQLVHLGANARRVRLDMSSLSR